MSSISKRREIDLMKLMMNDYSVETVNDSINVLNVEFHGPKESPYEGGVWKVRVKLPDAYPYRPPAIKFVNTIFHPNVDERSGTVCLDVIRDTWSPMFDLLNVFEVFLPQLLLYPNPSSPLNNKASSLMGQDKARYEQKVKDLLNVFEIFLPQPLLYPSDTLDSDASSLMKDKAQYEREVKEPLSN